jgi:hypothetical protein
VTCARDSITRIWLKDGVDGTRRSVGSGVHRAALRKGEELGGRAPTTQPTRIVADLGHGTVYHLHGLQWEWVVVTRTGRPARDHLV